MGIDFKKAFNKFADTGTKLNREVNNIIGKDVFKDIKKIEPEREYKPIEDFQKYEKEEPKQWVSMTGEEQKFSIMGQSIVVSKNLDICMKYRNVFKESALYYKERFVFTYKECVEDFDSFMHYFPEMYLEGLMDMVNRANSVLLPFGIFNSSDGKFVEEHMNRYRSAVLTYEQVGGIEEKRNEQADNLGDIVGNSLHITGGGFGFKGAAKGIAGAEAFNLGLGMFGKFVAHQNKMSPEEKKKVFDTFKEDVFFTQVYNDYYNTYYTMIQILLNNKLLKNIRVSSGAEYKSIAKNLQNPMFPRENIIGAICNLIQTYPFETKTIDLLIDIYGKTDEIEKIEKYYVV